MLVLTIHAIFQPPVKVATVPAHQPSTATAPAAATAAQNMEYKFVELLSCRFMASSEEVVRAQVGGWVVRWVWQQPSLGAAPSCHHCLSVCWELVPW
jgi:hypothetical protein